MVHQIYLSDGVGIVEIDAVLNETKRHPVCCEEAIWLIGPHASKHIRSTSQDIWFAFHFQVIMMHTGKAVGNVAGW